jgi:hypothetical protein
MLEMLSTNWHLMGILHSSLIPLSVVNSTLISNTYQTNNLFTQHHDVVYNKKIKEKFTYS